MDDKQIARVKFRDDDEASGMTHSLHYAISRLRHKEKEPTGQCFHYCSSCYWVGTNVDIEDDDSFQCPGCHTIIGGRDEEM